MGHAFDQCSIVLPFVADDRGHLENLGEVCQIGNVGSKTPNGRHHERSNVRVMARFLYAGRQIAGQIKDISAGAARIDIDEPVEPHTAITLSIDQFGDSEGEIVWSSGAP